MSLFYESCAGADGRSSGAPQKLQMFLKGMEKIFKNFTVDIEGAFYKKIPQTPSKIFINLKNSEQPWVWYQVEQGSKQLP